MNCKQANEQIAIVDFLSSTGFEVQRTGSGAAWFFSPLRTEHTPSFKVNISRNLWYDYGLGKGGKLMDLIMLQYGVNIPGALEILNGARVTPLVDQLPISQRTDASGVKIDKVKKLENRALLQYVESRMIPVSLAKRYLRECYYQLSSGKYFALAWANDSGGYELRNKYAQLSTSPKDVTTIKGADNRTVAVFEGVFDFLSAMVFFRREIPATDAIVLNSVALVAGTLPALASYENANLFLDNDPAGRGAVKLIQDKVPNAVSWSDRYYPHCKDFNELLCAGKESTTR